MAVLSTFRRCAALGDPSGQLQRRLLYHRVGGLSSHYL